MSSGLLVNYLITEMIFDLKQKQKFEQLALNCFKTAFTLIFNEIIHKWPPLYIKTYIHKYLLNYEILNRLFV